jgi:hypothetical protein
MRKVPHFEHSGEVGNNPNGGKYGIDTLPIKSNLRDRPRLSHGGLRSPGRGLRSELSLRPSRSKRNGECGWPIATD